MPDLKGINPINGAMFFERKHGVTCHLMDDGVDTGDIVYQIEIPITPDIDLGLLYQISFMAESEVFELAYKRNFVPIDRKLISKNYLYYSRKEQDLMIDFNNDNLEMIIKKIKSFAAPSQGAYFLFNNLKFKVMDIRIVTNSFLMKKIDEFVNCEVILKYNNNIVIRFNNDIVVLQNILCDNFNEIKIGDVINVEK